MMEKENDPAMFTTFPHFNIRERLRKERGQFRKFAFRLFRIAGIHSVWRFLIQRKKLTILLYHDPDPHTFAEHIEHLEKYFTFISLKEYTEARLNKKMRDLPRYPLVVSIDDGHAGNYQLLQVIKDKGFPITIFLTSGIVGTHRHFWWSAVKSEEEIRRLKSGSYQSMQEDLNRSGFVQDAANPCRQALNKEEILAMAPYVDFQAHTRFHPVLPMCNSAQAYEEIHGSKVDLANDYDLSIYALAYPHGYYSARDIELVKNADFQCAVTVDEGLNNATTDLFRLKRIAIPDDADPDELIIKASGFWAALATITRKCPEHGFKVKWEA
jgi:peptidoglycan/xylan/chitin deacetylase (PgdA/CDA1 family)